MYYDFISNVIVVLFLCGVGICIDLSLNKKYSRYLLGVIFGLITIFVIHGHIKVAGRFFDLRHITMTMAGFIGGPVTAAIAAIISSLYRYNVGGNGSMGGFTNIIAFACFGCILGRYLRSKQNGKKPLLWFMIGLIMACTLLFIIGFIHQWKIGSLSVLRTVSGPYLIITPLATTIIFNFYFWTREFFGKASILDTIINCSPINLMIFDTNGPIMLSTTLKTQNPSYPYIKNPNLLLDPDKPWQNATKQHREIATEDGRHFVTDLSRFQMPSGEYVCVAIVNDVTDRHREQERLRRAKEKFSKAFQLGPHMMSIIRKSDYKCVDVNRRFLEARGFDYENVIGKTPVEIGVSVHKFNEIMTILREKGALQNFEDAIITKNGLQGTVLFSAVEIEIDDQECILFAYNDITDIKRMQTERVEQLTKHIQLEEELSKSNQVIADIINNMPDGFYSLDNQWRFTFVNKKAAELFQKTREELLDKVLWNTIPQVRGTLLEHNYLKAKNDCIPITFEYLSFLQKDTWYQITTYPSRFGLSVYYRDITEKKLAHEELIKSQEELASILESMTDCFFAMDKNWQFTYVNRAGEIAFEKSRDELLGLKLTEVLGPINDTALGYYREVISEKRPVNFEIVSKALGNKWIEITAYPTETGMSCYFRDISSRKIAEETLRQSEEKFSKAFHGGPIMMTLATVDEGKFIDANEALCSITGYTREEIIGSTTKELDFFVEIDKRNELSKMLLEQGKIENGEVDFRTKSGEIRNGISWSQLFYLNGKPCHITGLIDVTEQKRIQREMARLDRLNLVGQLAAGIGHELRNPMTTVRGYLQLLGTKPDYAAQKSTFDLMISELDRANSIITEFLSLAQIKQTELKSQNLNVILNHLYPLLEADTFTQNKQISFIPGEIPDLYINAKEISQLVLNLARNGLEAMRERSCLTVKSYIQDGKVVLAIADEGCGIPAENMNKIGTPFFTTKDNGTGLGLATCYKIAESHNAKVHIDSGPRGTTFFILFPIPDNEQDQKVFHHHPRSEGRPG